MAIEGIRLHGILVPSEYEIRTYTDYLEDEEAMKGYGETNDWLEHNLSFSDLLQHRVEMWQIWAACRSLYQNMARG